MFKGNLKKEEIDATFPQYNDEMPCKLDDFCKYPRN